MGNSVDTSALCPLCNELTPKPVILKCNHRFCQRCIGDLWSVSPSGPYCCPEWKCKTVYKTLPFDSIAIPPISTNRYKAGSSSKAEVNTFDSTLRRPSLTSRLLGKRKASTPVLEQPSTKRPTVQSPHELSNDIEPPTTSFSNQASQSADVEPSREAERQESAPEQGDGSMSSSDSSGNGVTLTNDNPQNISNQQKQPESENVLTVDDSDNSSEVDICDAPAFVTPKKDTVEIPVSLKKPASPAKANLSTGVSTPGKEKSPGHHVGRSPLMFPKHPVATPSSSSHAYIFPRPESKNTSPVSCHYCPHSGQQCAVKTCLVCGASMCAEHLRPHLDSPVFQNHTLVAPMEDISSWRCQEHQEMNRIFCRQCGVCVCTVCTVIGSHRDHVCISIREAERELRGNLKDEIKQLQKAEQQLINRVTELTQKKDDFRVVLSEARAGVKQQYGAIKEALEEEEQSALQCIMQEDNRALGGLEDQLSHLQKSLVSIQQGLHTLEGLADAKGDKRIQDQAFIMEYGKVTQMVADSTCVEQLEAPEEVNQARLKCLQRWTEKRLDTVVISVPGRDLYTLRYGTIPLMDADTAHPKLLLSENNRKVTYSETQQAYTESDARFTSFPQVLASRTMEGGCWYWEVNVSVDEGRWKVGLCEGQIERKGQKDSSRLGFNSYSWCLGCERRKVEALHNKVVVSVAAEGLQRVGVFLDFDEGVLSFFNVTPEGSLVLLHSYKHRFSDPLYPALSVSKTHLTICDLFKPSSTE
ncbi:hypothetical protein LDENG_00192880 [Lucifuga dentata]|nr:hypothetical protein LDENG_00192880 [Lucifuga dentata]